MNLEMLKEVNLQIGDEDSSISITFNHLSQEFTDTDRVLVLYSDIKYNSGSFTWNAVLPTVRVPYRDPAMGFLLNGLIFSSVSVYQRAPGVVLGTGKDARGRIYDKLDIVTSRNTTLSIVQRDNSIYIVFSRNKSNRYIPIGVFLKALSGLPYEVILKRCLYKPPMLLNSFPSRIGSRSVISSRTLIYGIDSYEEPSVDDCVSAVYTALMRVDRYPQELPYLAHWKLNRIRGHFNGLHFKSVPNYEANLSLHSRAIGNYLDQDLHIPIYEDADGVPTATEYFIPRGTYIDEKIAQDLSWYNVSALRVKTTRSFLIYEDTPMLFRAKGCMLVNDLPELGYHEGDIITEEMLTAINKTQITQLEVRSPVSQCVLFRSLENPELGDFITMLNILCTADFVEHDETSQYEVANRVVIDYDKQVLLEVEKVYQDIADSIIGCRQLSNIIRSLPTLPSNNLALNLRRSSNKELTQAEMTNVMSRAIADKRASALLPETPAAMTAIQRGQYGRIDSLHSPESDKVGSVQELTAMSRLNPDTNMIETPYEKVVNGFPTGEIEYISAVKEKNKYIVGWDDKLDKDVVMARYNGDVTMVSRERVNYRDASPFCDMSVSRMTVPFPEFSQPRRSLMATKMTGQAVPVLFPERPRVSTGADTEVPCLYYTARDIVTSCLGEEYLNEQVQLELVNVKWSKVMATYTCLYLSHSFTFSVPYTATDKKSLYNYNLNYREGYFYRLDDIVFYNQSCDIGEYDYWERVEQGALPFIKHFGKPSMALGVNLRVMYKTYGSSTIDDAVTISDRLIGNRKLSNIQIFKYEYELKSGERFSPFNAVVPAHKYIYADEPLITVVRKVSDIAEEPVEETETSEVEDTTIDAGSVKSLKERSVCAKQSGTVVISELNELEGRAEVWVATLHDAEVGDKGAGRHGNKFVIAKIVPEADMPYDPATGDTADIVFSPLGIPSRMNNGQLPEATLGAIMEAQGKFAVVTPFYPNIKEEIQDLYKQSGLESKRLYNPVYGKFTERPVMLGNIYFMKLEQMSNQKWAAVGYPVAVDPVFKQPVSSVNTCKGQTIGEYETWAYAAAGANNILNSLFTIYSSDRDSRERYFKSLKENIDASSEYWSDGIVDVCRPKVANQDALVTQTIFRMFGQDLGVEDGKYQVLPFNMNDIAITITDAMLRNYSENVCADEWCKVPLHSPVVNPFWIHNFPLGVILGIKSIKSLVNGKRYYDTESHTTIPVRELSDAIKSRCLTGIDAVIALLRNTTIEEAIQRIVNPKYSGDIRQAEAIESVDRSGEVDGIDIESIILDEVPSDAIDIDVDIEDSKSKTGTEGEAGQESVSNFDISSSVVNSGLVDEDVVDEDVVDDRSAISDSDDEDADDDIDTDDSSAYAVIEDLNSVFGDYKVPTEFADIVSFLRKMQAAGMELSDLVWDYMPIMPRLFRQPTVLGNKSHEHAFQKQLCQICDYSKSQDIYRALEQLIGYGDVSQHALMSIRGYFFGKGASQGKHGKVRGNVLSKRVGFSGRTVIVPASDRKMSPYFIGIPWRVAMVELSSVLSIRMSKASVDYDMKLRVDYGFPASTLSSLNTREWQTIIESLGEYNTYIFSKTFPKLSDDQRVELYNFLREVIRDICEGNVTPDGRVYVGDDILLPEEIPDNVTIDAAVVSVGRQPTLHKKSIRNFFMKLVDGYCTVIHPVVCSGFNADFDGDQMWHCQMFGEMKNESWRTLSVLQDLISEKDGSYTLSLAQDVALGLYCCTIYKDNTIEFHGHKGDYYFFDNRDILRLQLEYGSLHYYDVVLFLAPNGEYYLSTAGRILVNAFIPGAFTLIPFVDEFKICEQVLGVESIPKLKSLKYNTYLSATSEVPYDGRPKGIKIESILLDVYYTYGARQSVDTTQDLYEIGLTASDIYSVTASMDDMSVDVDISKYMVEPREYVDKLNTLEQLGLVSEQQKKDSSARAWDRARKSAMPEVIGALPANSNIFFLLYSGARSKPEQVMQSIGFIGAVSKTVNSDIEYPILRGYGHGLSSLDLCQTREMARIGVVSTQTGTKTTGYATRQTVYMLSGMDIEKVDCGISNCVESVEYDTSNVSVREPDGSVHSIWDLVGEVVNPAAEEYSDVLNLLNLHGFILTQDILSRLISSNCSELTLGDRTVELVVPISENWKRYALETGYSYALPYTVNRKITEKSLEWVAKHRLHEIIMFNEDVNKNDLCFDKEAYLPVKYDMSHYEVYLDGVVVPEEAICGIEVLDSSENFHYYKRMLDGGHLTIRALQYLTKKHVCSIDFADGRTARVFYQISPLFKSLVLGRISVGLPYLDEDSAITEATLKEIESLQLSAIPVRTSLTCLCSHGICQKCYGKSMTERSLLPVGRNIGIPAAQAQCQPLSQATLDVTHSAGKRGSGVGLVSGLGYYIRMLQGKLVTQNTYKLQEEFSDCSGYVRKNVHDEKFFQIVDEDGNVLDTRAVADAGRCNVPDGAYVDKGDTIISGWPDLYRYSSTDVFKSALDTRYLLLEEYYRIFAGLGVSPRNYEVLAKAQTSLCYKLKTVPGPLVKDCSEEIMHPTGAYILHVSSQDEVVNKYTGVAGFAFENVAAMLSMDVLSQEGLELNSVLGNIVTGTPIGSTTAKFIPKKFGKVNTAFRESAVGEATHAVNNASRVEYQFTYALAGEDESRRVDYQVLAGSLLDDIKALDAGISDDEEYDEDGLPILNTAKSKVPELGTSISDSGDGLDLMELGDKSSDEETSSVDVFDMEFGGGILEDEVEEVEDSIDESSSDESDIGDIDFESLVFDTKVSGEVSKLDLGSKPKESVEPDKSNDAD